jgi:hypothetical protein
VEPPVCSRGTKYAYFATCGDVGGVGDFVGGDWLVIVGVSVYTMG